MEIILKYFSGLSAKQKQQFEALGELYHDWNNKINVISRKDIDNIYDHHILHSLAIANAIKFRPETKILDFGTGGGFPGIPLAIMFPDVQFKLIDGTGKKIHVVKEISKAIGLNNCIAEQIRGENEKDKYDFIVSRAVMKLPDLIRIIKKNISKTQHNSMPNGIFCLKGGDVSAEISPFRHIAEVTDISKMFKEEWFKNKYLIYVPL